jgi:hypothetical protein
MQDTFVSDVQLSAANGDTMNKHVNIQEFSPSQGFKKPSRLRRVITFLATMLSAPKGDQGGWEGGARGL